MKKEVKPLTFELESELWSRGYKVVCGTDEAGRGPLVGPVVAGACILPEGALIEGLNDSKKLSEKKREALYDVICSTAVAWGVGIATPKEIDEINILNASMLAMRRAIENMCVKPDAVLVDGNCTRGFTIPAFSVVKGDSISPSIAAASILAKVTRDRYMVGMAKEYPYYAFEKNKGYGTKLHTDLIKEYGPCEIHRLSFLKNILGEK